MQMECRWVSQIFQGNRELCWVSIYPNHHKSGQTDTLGTGKPGYASFLHPTILQRDLEGFQINRALFQRPTPTLISATNYPKAQSVLTSQIDVRENLFHASLIPAKCVLDSL